MVVLIEWIPIERFAEVAIAQRMWTYRAQEIALLDLQWKGTTSLLLIVRAHHAGKGAQPVVEKDSLSASGNVDQSYSGDYTVNYKITMERNSISASGCSEASCWVE